MSLAALSPTLFTKELFINACRDGDQELAEVLLRRGADINWKHELSPHGSGLHYAVRENHGDLVDTLLAYPGVDVNIKTGCEPSLTPLMVACIWGRKNITRKLLQADGIDVNCQAVSGSTALHLAVTGDESVCAQLLCEAPGLKWNLKDANGHTPLLKAAFYGSANTLQMILNLPQPGLDFNATTDDGLNVAWCALDMKVMAGLDEVDEMRKEKRRCVELLCDDPRVDWNFRDPNTGNTPLLSCLNRGEVEMAKILIRNPQVDLNVGNNNGDFPETIARKRNQTDILELLWTFTSVQLRMIRQASRRSREAGHVPPSLFSVARHAVLLNLTIHSPERLVGPLVDRLGETLPEKLLQRIRAYDEFAILSLVKQFSEQFFLILMLVVVLRHCTEIKDFLKSDASGMSGHNNLLRELDVDEKMLETDTSTNWINDIISVLWTSCLSKFLTVEKVTNLLEEGAKVCEEKHHPSIADLLRRIEVEEMTVGNPIRVTDLSVLSQTRDTLAIKLDVVYPGDALMALKLRKTGLIGCSAEIFDIELSLQIVLEPFNDSSLLGGISLSFLEPPKLVLEGGGLLWLPIEVVTLLMESLVVPLMKYLMIEPQQIRLNFPVSPLKTRDPAGIIRVMLLEGNLSGATNPYAYLRLGRDFCRTNIPKPGSGGKWNFYTEFPFLKAGPAEQELKIEMWNRNRFWENDRLGMTSIDINNIDGELSDIWLDVSSVDGGFAGEVRCLIEFVPCSLETTATSKQGILVIFIKKIETTKSIQPVIVAQVSGEKPCYTVTGRFGASFSFEEQLTLLVRDIDNDQLNLRIGDVNQHCDLSSLVLKAESRFSEETGYLICKELPHKEEHLHYETVGELIIPVSELKHARDFEQHFPGTTATGSKVEFTTKFFTIPEDFQEENKLLTYYSKLEKN